MTLPKAQELLDEYISSPSLKIHSIAVSVSTAYYADIFNGDKNKWQITGLLHDLDYERYPDMHPAKCIELLEKMGEDNDMIHAIQAHADQSLIESDLDKVLFACDEMSGFVYASILVRPGKTLDGMEAKSVIKKVKDKAFAKNVSRDDLYKGAEILGITIEEHISNIITAFTSSRNMLGV